MIGTMDRVRPSVSVQAHANIFAESVNLPKLHPVHVKITVHCGADHVIGVWVDSIAERWPFWCEECGIYKTPGPYPWSLTTEIVSGDYEPGLQG